MEQPRTFKDQWFPIAIDREIKANRIYPKTLFGQKLILFRDAQDQVVCLDDQCSHMGIPLSKGTVARGELTCCYHGWSFNGQGQCIRIPRLPSDSAKVRERACVKNYPTREQYGMIWITTGRIELCRDEERAAILLVHGERAAYYSTKSLTHYDFPSHYSIASLNAFDFSHVHIHALLKRVLKLSSGSYKKTHIRGDSAQTLFVDASGQETEVTMQRSPSLQVAFKRLTSLRLTRFIEVSVDLQVFGTPTQKNRSFLFAFPIFHGRPRFLLKVLRPIVDFVLRFSFAEDIEIFRFQQETKEKGGEFYKNLSPLDASWIKIHHWLNSFDESALYVDAAEKTRESVKEQTG